MTSIALCCYLLCVSLWWISGIEGHVRFMKPLSRSSMWRKYPQQAGAVNYNDNRLFCGGRYIQTRNDGKCGICGDSYEDSQPRENEVGGKYYTGFIPPESRYKQGQTIETYLKFTANHKGYVQFKVCPYRRTRPTQEVRQSCLDRNVLSIRQPNGTWSKRHDIQSGLFEGYFQVRLPSNLNCQHCVFQFRYRTGNNYGVDKTTGQSCLGCGSQEEFWGCADISISRGSGDFWYSANNVRDSNPFISGIIAEAQDVLPKFETAPAKVKSYTFTTCLDTVTVPEMPCCYGLFPGFSNFCMTRGGADCPPNVCRRRNERCSAGAGTGIRCTGVGEWTGVLDHWCLHICLLSKSIPFQMCACERTSL